MKLEINRNFPFIHTERVLSPTAEAGQNLWGGAPHFKPKNISQYFDLFYDNETVQRAITDLSETGLGQGYFTSVVDEKYDKAKTKCDDFAEEWAFDERLPNIGRNMLIAGFMPVESQINKFASKSVIKFIDPRNVDKMNLDEYALLDSIDVKNERGYGTVKVPKEYLAHFTYNKVGNDCRGTSLIRGISTLLSYQESAVQSMDKVLRRYASPMIVWKSRAIIDAIKKAVLEAEAGEDLFLGQLSQEEMADLFTVIQMDPRARFYEYIDRFDLKIFEGLGAPSLYYMRNATEASATVMDTIVQRNVNALQRNVKRVVERNWFKPLVEQWGFTDKEAIPHFNWGIEKSGVEDLPIGELIIAGINVGYIGRTALIKLLQDLGLPFEDEEPEMPTVEVPTKALEYPPKECIECGEPTVMGMMFCKEHFDLKIREALNK